MPFHYRPRSTNQRKEPVPDMTSVQTYQHSSTGKKDKVRKKVLIIGRRVEKTPFK